MQNLNKNYVGIRPRWNIAAERKPRNDRNQDRTPQGVDAGGWGSESPWWGKDGEEAGCMNAWMTD